MVAASGIVFVRHDGEIQSIETGRSLRHPAHPCNTLTSCENSASLMRFVHRMRRGSEECEITCPARESKRLSNRIATLQGEAPSSKVEHPPGAATHQNVRSM